MTGVPEKMVQCCIQFSLGHPVYWNVYWNLKSMKKCQPYFLLISFVVGPVAPWEIISQGYQIERELGSASFKCIVYPEN